MLRNAEYDGAAGTITVAQAHNLNGRLARLDSAERSAHFDEAFDACSSVAAVAQDSCFTQQHVDLSAVSFVGVDQAEDDSACGSEPADDLADPADPADPADAHSDVDVNHSDHMSIDPYDPNVEYDSEGNDLLPAGPADPPRLQPKTSNRKPRGVKRVHDAGTEDNHNNNHGVNGTPLPKRRRYYHKNRAYPANHEDNAMPAFFSSTAPDYLALEQQDDDDRDVYDDDE